MLKQHLRRSLFPLILSGLLSGSFVVLFIDRSLASFFLFMLMGFMCYISIYSYSLFFNQWLRHRLPVYASLMINTVVSIVLIYINLLLIILLVNIHDFLRFIENWRSFFLSDSTINGMIFGFGLSLFINAYLSISELFGQKNLINLFLGRYSIPREEERVFMFVDLKASTTIAEKLGHKNYLNFLNEFFFDISRAIAQNKGSIYKYVGDEVIVHWKTPSAFRYGRCIQTFIDMQVNVAHRSTFYLKKYGIIPEFKAGLHGGFVVSGELGTFRKEITFIGDVMNTTARIEGSCNKLNHNILFSEYIAKRLKTPTGYKQILVDSVLLRGKSESMNLYSIEKH